MPETTQAHDEIQALIDLCRSGGFYAEHDKSLAVLGRAQQALDRLTAAIGTHDADREEGRCSAPIEYYIWNDR